MTDFEQLGLTQIIRLQNQLSAVLVRRFERLRALAFSDIVASTAYFARFGDEAGRRLQQHHIDLHERALGETGGRIVDTAGDGIFLCFPTVPAAVEELSAFQQLRADANARQSREQRLETRTGVHWGPVLTDGVIVTGEAVNLCARLAEAARPESMLLTRQAYLELPARQRLRCHALEPLALSGVAGLIEVVQLQWRDPSRFPTRVRIEETGEDLVLPDQPTVTFGRLTQRDGTRANDVVLALPDPALTRQISRWHFELRREPAGLVLRPLSGQPTEVNGQVVPAGQECPVGSGTLIKLSGVITLRLMSLDADHSDDTVSIVGPKA